MIYGRRLVDTAPLFFVIQQFPLSRNPYVSARLLLSMHVDA